MTPASFTSLPSPTPDAIFAIGQEAKAAGPNAINGTIGIYMDEQGKPMMFPSVRSALEDVRNDLTTRSYSYPPLTGLPEFRLCIERLIFGDNHGLRIASLATTGGTGAVAINLRLAKLLQKDPSVIFPTPTWANHRQLCDEAGMGIIECPYLSAPRNGSTPLTTSGRSLGPSIEGIIDVVKKTPAPALVLLHAGCHNPTGLDLTKDQWEELLTVLRDHGAIALMDFAYQGFAGTPEEDAFPIRRAAELGVTALVCWSASKNHCIYAERTGLACAVATDEETKKKIEGHYMTLTRKIHSAAATFGQSIVTAVQTGHQREWLADLQSARETMMTKRRLLSDGLPEEFKVALKGNGMFAQLPLSSDEITRLKTEHQVFLVGDGRINIAGIPMKRIDELARKIRTVHR